MKKENVILTIVLVMFVVCVALVLVFRFNANEEEETTVTLDLESLEKSIDESTEFGETTMQSIDKTLLSETFGIEEEKIEEVIGKIPLVNVHSNMYVIVKATDTQYVKEKFEEYGTSYEEQWRTYLPEQYELVQKRKIGVKGDYVYFIVSDSAEEIISIMK